MVRERGLFPPSQRSLFVCVPKISNVRAKMPSAIWGATELIQFHVVRRRFIFSLSCKRSARGQDRIGNFVSLLRPVFHLAEPAFPRLSFLLPFPFRTQRGVFCMNPQAGVIYLSLQTRLALYPNKDPNAMIYFFLALFLAPFFVLQSRLLVFLRHICFSVLFSAMFAWPAKKFVLAPPDAQTLFSLDK